MKFETREEWLAAATRRLAGSVFKQAGIALDPDHIKVTCGFPSKGALAMSKRRVGECWDKTASSDGRTFHIMVTPLSAGATPIKALDILCHELVHAAVGSKAGHRTPFKRAALAIGLTGKMTATVAGVKLLIHLTHLAKELGPYPHVAINAAALLKKRDGTRLLKAVCPECGYTIRVTRKWLEVGLPSCPCGEWMREVTR